MQTWEIPKTVRQNEVYMSFRSKEKRVGVWDFKGKEGYSREDEKEQMFGKQIFAMPWRDNGTVRTLVSRPCRVPPTIPSPHSLWVSLVIVLSLDQALYPNSVGS